MYESQNEQTILNRMLARVPDNVDKRPGSVIYDALAPAAAELAQMYVELDLNYNISFADTASGEYLARRTAEFGVTREPATKARRKGQFYNAANAPFDIPIGSRFSIENLNYIAINKISTGVFTMECEQVGIVGNQKFGAMLPIDYIAGLSRAELTDVLVPGEDAESDDALRVRYYEEVNRPAFGGNVADYKQKINAMSGVGATKIFPVWQGGGTAKGTIIASDWTVPSSQLVSEVQTAVDPTVNSGLGIGTAPIGHVVTIAGVQGVTINVETTVTLASGTVLGQVQTPIEEAIEAYLLTLRQDWANQPQLVIRIAFIDASILMVPGIADVNGTQINGSTANLTLGAEQIPVLGTVTVHA
ncbi:baseplate J/gp47 family protein [Paenibacillus hemerocallicola]|uniref:Baseplate J/gp47 family protein n=1 Tax=Paenibacillus hemerocallicola TaxID=1172614 RepID=A0A5C4TGY5_9BACL|nr:baseplate J/gp47 family protein [Paenibacillus hemerocallicola]TNJ68235.1 baseplate J/gp47 family protein [Paenibacillus hemerocallicola]